MSRLTFRVNRGFLSILSEGVIWDVYWLEVGSTSLNWLRCALAELDATVMRKEIQEACALSTNNLALEDKLFSVGMIWCVVVLFYYYWLFVVLLVFLDCFGLFFS